MEPLPLEEFDSLWRLGFMEPVLHRYGGRALSRLAKQWAPDGDVVRAWWKDSPQSSTVMMALVLGAGLHVQADRVAADAVRVCEAHLRRPVPAVHALERACRAAATLPAGCRDGVGVAQRALAAVLAADDAEVDAGRSTHDVAHGAAAFARVLLCSPSSRSKFDAWREGVVWLETSRAGAVSTRRLLFSPERAGLVLRNLRTHVPLGLLVQALLGNPQAAPNAAAPAQ